MDLRQDRRAAALQVGAVLLLGFLVIALSLYQATVVPEENERVEFRHSQQVQDDMVEVRNGLQRAGTTGDIQAVSVRMGTTYPSRILFVNPGPPGGVIRNGTERRVTFSNVSATDDETADFLNTDANGPYGLDTKNLSYRPGYNVYRSAPTTTYQSGVLVNEFDDANDTAVTDQALIRDDEIYLVAVAGNLSRGQMRAYAVDPRSLSTASAATAITNESGRITVSVPTTLTEERWETLLDDQDRVRSVTKEDGRVSIRLADGTYRLRTALVGVGTGGEAPGPAYLTTVDPNGGADVAVEVRDRYNNPVPNSRVAGNLTVNVTGGTDVLDPDSVEVGEDGRARFTHAGETGTANLTLFDDGTGALETADNGNGSVEVDVSDADLSDGDGDGGAGGEINPNRSDGVVLAGAEIGTRTVPPSATPDVNITLRNLDADGDRDVEQVRFNFYNIDAQSNNPRAAPRSVDISNRTLKSANNGGRFKEIDPITVPADGTETFTVTFFRNEDGTDEFDVQMGDFFVLSVVFDDGDTATYFVAPE